jgi:hypothetical protein
MIFEYALAYPVPVPYKGIDIYYDPYIVIPASENMQEQTYAEYYGMTDEEANEVILQAKWAQIRVIRNALLKECDWTQGRDVPASIYQPWAVYRDALRNLTTAATPEDVVFPTAPLI